MPFKAAKRWIEEQSSRSSRRDELASSTGSELDISGPMSFRHEGHISSDGVAAKFSFNQSTAGLSAREVEYLKREAEYANRTANITRPPPAAPAPPPPPRPKPMSAAEEYIAQYGQPGMSAREESTDSLGGAPGKRKSWAKAGAAARVAGKMSAKRIQDEIRKNEALLLQAQAELRAANSALFASDAAVHRALAADAAALPPGWEELIDPAGVPYYFHQASGETTWDRPVERLPPAAVLSAALQDEGWTTLFDAESGRAYYFNNKSGESSWEPPAEAPPMWKALGIQKSQLDAEPELAAQLDAAVSAGDFEAAIAVRDELRLAGGRRTSKMGHVYSAQL